MGEKANLPKILQWNLAQLHSLPKEDTDNI